MENIILNGCSFIAGHVEQTSTTLGYHLKNLSGKAPINLALHGSGNERMFRTTYEYLSNNKITNRLVVLGITHWARMELYDEIKEKFYHINFWSNNFKSMLNEVLTNIKSKYVDNEIELIDNKGWDSTFLKKFIIFYLAAFKNEKIEREKIEREIILFEHYCKANNNILITFNSLDGASESFKSQSYIKIQNYNNWSDIVETKNLHHSDPDFSAHPNSESNLQVAKLILKEYEIRN